MRAGVRKGGAAARAHFLLKMHASTPRSYGAFSAVHRRAAEDARLHPSTRRLRVDAWVHTSSLFTFFCGHGKRPRFGPFYALVFTLRENGAGGRCE